MNEGARSETPNRKAPQGGSGTAPPEKALIPSELRVRVGNLTIESRPRQDGGRSHAVMPHQVRICINGQPVNVRRLVLTVDMKQLVTAQVEFLPRESEADPSVSAPSEAPREP